jgi:predicted phage-related endonuclease
MENIKLDQEEIENITNLQQKFNEALTALGTAEYQITALQEQRQTIHNELKDMKKQEQELYNELLAKYGEGYISLETGEFVKQ